MLSGFGFRNNVMRCDIIKFVLQQRLGENNIKDGGNQDLRQNVKEIIFLGNIQSKVSVSIENNNVFSAFHEA